MIKKVIPGRCVNIGKNMYQNAKTCGGATKDFPITICLGVVIAHDVVSVNDTAK